MTLALAASLAVAQDKGKGKGAPGAPPIILTIAGFSDGGSIPDKYTCAVQPAGGSPAIQWTDPAPTAVSFAIIMHDLDVAPRRGFDDVLHWVIWNIPAGARQLAENLPTTPDLADGSRQGNNIAGRPGYFAPCAGPGPPHHYVFELYALDQKLDLPATASRAEIQKAIDGHAVGKAAYIGLFHR
jgi:hypothetical protein